VDAWISAMPMQRGNDALRGRRGRIAAGHVMQPARCRLGHSRKSTTTDTGTGNRCPATWWYADTANGGNTVSNDDVKTLEIF